MIRCEFCPDLWIIHHTQCRESVLLAQFKKVFQRKCHSTIHPTFNVTAHFEQWCRIVAKRFEFGLGIRGVLLGKDPIRSSLKEMNLRGSLSNLRNELHCARRASDNGDALAGEIM